MIRRVLLVLTILAFHSSLLAGEEVELAQKACKKVCEEFAQEISKAIHDTILEKGIVGAIATCADFAEDLAASYSKRPGLEVERITLLKLKENKRLKSYEALALKKMISSAKKGEKPSDEQFMWSESKGGKSRGTYLGAIKVQPICLTCHGPKNMVQPDVRKIMLEKYGAMPSENQVGEIKGAILVNLQLPEGRAILESVEQEKKETKE